MKIWRVFFAALIAFSTPVPAGAEPPVKLKHSRRALGSLSPAAAHKVATGNFHRLIRAGRK